MPDTSVTELISPMHTLPFRLTIQDTLTMEGRQTVLLSGHP